MTVKEFLSYAIDETCNCMVYDCTSGKNIFYGSIEDVEEGKYSELELCSFDSPGKDWICVNVAL